jgi:hypothetical protein
MPGLRTQAQALKAVLSGTFFQEKVDTTRPLCSGVYDGVLNDKAAQISSTGLLQ